MSWFSYIKVSLRTLFLHRSFSLLTLVGLSVGIAMSMLVLQFVFYQTSFDSFYSQPDDIYRVVSSGHLSDDSIGAALVPMILGPSLEQYEEVAVLTRVIPASENLVKSKFQESFESDIVYADPRFFQVFDRPFLLGDSVGCLDEISGVAISASAASRFFGTRNPLGRSIEIDDSTSFTVKAVFKDVPRNSHFKYDIVLPFESMSSRVKKGQRENYLKSMKSWFVLSGYTYFRVVSGVNIDSLQFRLNKEADQLMNPEIIETFADVGSADLNFEFQNIRHIYLFSDLDFEIGETTHPVYVYIFLAVAIFILAVSAINFMNLTIARASTRFKEVAVRRIFGARRSHIVYQFIVESVLFSFLSLFFGLVLVELFTPYFSQLFHLELTGSIYREQFNILWIIGITFCVGLFSGSYPALFFSGIPPHSIFKENNIFNQRGVKLRALLVILQIIVATVVITIALGMHQQLRFIDKTELGFNKNNLFIVERTGLLNEKMDTVIGTLKQVEGLESVVKLYQKPGDNISLISFFHGGDTSKVFLLGVHYVDCHLFDALEVKMAQGHSLTKYECADSSQVLINEAGARLLNINSVEGEYIETVSRSGGRSRFKVVGVVKDLYFDNLKQALRPTIYLPATAKMTVENLLVRFDGEDSEGAKKRIGSVWNNLIPGIPIRISTVSDNIAAFYDEDRRYGSIAEAFAFLALFIASLGLIGLVTFIMGCRKKQMVIRKLAGAPTSSIWWHTFKGYFFSVVFGVILSVPLSTILLNAWLETFALNFGINPFCFLGPAILVVAIAFVTAVIGGVVFMRRALRRILNDTL